MSQMPEMREPMAEWTAKLLDAALQRHTLWCMRHGVGAEVQKQKIRLAALVGFMAGSGLLGGAAGAALARWFGG